MVHQDRLRTNVGKIHTILTFLRFSQLFPNDKWDDNLGQDGTGQQGAAAAWDDALWPQLCESYGADSARGFNWDQFLALFRAHQATVEAREHLTAVKTNLKATRALAEAYKVGAISRAQFDSSSRRLREGLSMAMSSN
jgi:hypothetical protein